MPMPQRVARFNRRVTNPVLGVLSDRVPPFASLHHIGRRSGRRYRTPVFAFPTTRGVVIALTYGTQVEWLRNIEAAGGARMVRRGTVLILSEPTLLHGSVGARLVPAVIRGPLRLMRVDDFVELTAHPLGS